MDHICLGPQDQSPGSVSKKKKKVGNNIAKATSDWNSLKITVKMTIQIDRPASRGGALCLCLGLIIKGFKEPPRDRKKQKSH